MDDQIADSACTATAYLCGVKANRGTIGVTARVQRRDCTAAIDEQHQVLSIGAWALKDGRDAGMCVRFLLFITNDIRRMLDGFIVRATGVVTTTRIGHASPAGVFARTADRDWESDVDVHAAGCAPDAQRDIAHQLVHEYPGNRLKVIHCLFMRW